MVFDVCAAATPQPRINIHEATKQVSMRRIVQFSLVRSSLSFATYSSYPSAIRLSSSLGYHTVNNPSYGFFPWKRSFKLAKEGTWDGSVVWVDSDERREHFLYSDAVVPSKFAFFHLKGSDFDWNSYEELRGIRIGGTLGYAYSEEFDAAEKAGIIKTNRAPSDEIGLKKLLKGRIEAFPGEVMVTYAQIRDTFSQEDAALFTHHPKAINEDPMYLLLSKKVAGNDAMRDLFNEGLKRLKESGRYDRIIADALAGKYAKP